MAWVSAALIGGGLAASIGGGIIGRNDALSNAAAQAEARNKVVADAIGKLDAFGATNRATFNANMGAYDPATQAATLAKDQATRGANNVAAITTQDPNATPIQADASPATRSDLAKRMLAVHDQAVARAKAAGNLGGYSDAWVGNQLGNAQAGRDIGVVNNYAEGRKSLVQPEADLAAAAAYKPPSIWGALLSGAGSIASAAGGAGIGKSIGALGGSSFFPSSAFLNAGATSGPGFMSF